jgi:hypothetical protein
MTRRHVERARAELSTAIKMYREMTMTFWLARTEATLADMGTPVSRRRDSDYYRAMAQ